MWIAYILLWGLVNTVMTFKLFLCSFVAGGNTAHSELYGASRSHSLDTPHSVGLLWTTHQPDAETSTSQHTTPTTNIHAPDGIQTHDPSKRDAQVHALDHAATGIGFNNHLRT
jgi:hypothetical protein